MDVPDSAIPSAGVPAPLDLAAIRARANLAHPGPWVWARCYELGRSVHWAIKNPLDDSRVSNFHLVLLADKHTDWDGVPLDQTPDFRFIAAARTDVPALCDRVEELERALARSEKELADFKDDVLKHTGDPLAASLAYEAGCKDGKEDAESRAWELIDKMSAAKLAAEAERDEARRLLDTQTELAARHVALSDVRREALAGLIEAAEGYQTNRERGNGVPAGAYMPDSATSVLGRAVTAARAALTGGQP